jgi:hypothetical protein
MVSTPLARVRASSLLFPDDTAQFGDGLWSCFDSVWTYGRLCDYISCFGHGGKRHRHDAILLVIIWPYTAAHVGG